MSSQNKSTEARKDYQFETLKHTLIKARDNTKYYKELFNDYSFNPGKLQSVDDIKALPYLTKDIIIKRMSDHPDDVLGIYSKDETFYGKI